MSEGDEPGADTEPLVAVARLVKTHGLNGAIVADLLTDFPDRFEGLERLIAVKQDGTREELKLEDYRLQPGRIVLKFAGYDSIDDAAALIGDEVAVPESERVTLSNDEYYDWELVGCRVETVQGDSVGSVCNIMHLAGGEVELLEVESDTDRRKHLIPLVASICVEIDVERKLIRVDPPEGLLEF